MKILVVDDVKGWRDYHIYVLNELFSEAEIYEADSARAGYDMLMQNNEEPFDIITTDLQMETDFEPKYAGEWFVEQIKTFKSHAKARVVIISAAYNVRHIAEGLGVDCIPKPTARKFPDAYNFLKD